MVILLPWSKTGSAMGTSCLLGVWGKVLRISVILTNSSDTELGKIRSAQREYYMAPSQLTFYIIDNISI